MKNETEQLEQQLSRAIAIDDERDRRISRLKSKPENSAPPAPALEVQTLPELPMPL
jgi:hypothetical protein